MLSGVGTVVPANAVVLTRNHATLLHIPIACLEAFLLDEPLRARVVGSQVYVTGTLR